MWISQDRFFFVQYTQLLCSLCSPLFILLHLLWLNINACTCSFLFVLNSTVNHCARKDICVYLFCISLLAFSLCLFLWRRKKTTNRKGQRSSNYKLVYGKEPVTIVVNFIHTLSNWKMSTYNLVSAVNFQ